MTTEQPSTTTRGFTIKVVLSFVAVYLIWGSTYLGIKYAIESMPPYLMAGARFALAGAAMTAWLVVAGGFRGELPARKVVASAALVGILMLGFGNGLVVWAISRGAPTGLVAVLIATTPFWLVLIDRYVDRDSRVHPLVVAGLLVGFVGIAVLSGLGGTAPKGIDGPALLAVLGATLSWACGSMLSKNGPRPTNPLVSTALQMFFGGTALLLYSALAEDWSAFDPAAVTARSWLGFAYLVVFGSLVAYTAFIWLLRHVSAAAVGTYAYVNPVVAVVLGTILNAEPFTPRTMVASTLIVVAVVLLTRARSRPKRSLPPAVPAIGAATSCQR
ncbi:MAG: EamA family transporter [Phycisphaerales bacterium]|nr:EamA family transporter [Phycisphaerales bacterium]